MGPHNAGVRLSRPVSIDALEFPIAFDRVGKRGGSGSGGEVERWIRRERQKVFGGREVLFSLPGEREVQLWFNTQTTKHTNAHNRSRCWRKLRKKERVEDARVQHACAVVVVVV